MRSLFLVLSLIFTGSISFAETNQNLLNRRSLLLQPGDVILLSLTCFSCRMIEAESGTRFSHSGIVFFDQSGKVRIAQALGDVHSVKLEEFLSYSDSTRPPFVIRNRELEQRFLKKDSAIEEFNSSLREIYESEFLGADFDHDYLWENVDELGREKLYCSEFIAKILNKFLLNKIQPKKMSFKINKSFWMTYFHGKIPEGLPGLSPATFYRSQLFMGLGSF